MIPVNQLIVYSEQKKDSHTAIYKLKQNYLLIMNDNLLIDIKPCI